MQGISVPQAQSFDILKYKMFFHMVPQIQVVPYIQSIGSGSFNTLGGSRYGRISQIVSEGIPGLVASTPLGTNIGWMAGNYVQHVDIL